MSKPCPEYGGLRHSSRALLRMQADQKSQPHARPFSSPGHALNIINIRKLSNIFCLGWGTHPRNHEVWVNTESFDKPLNSVSIAEPSSSTYSIDKCNGVYYEVWIMAVCLLDPLSAQGFLHDKSLFPCFLVRCRAQGALHCGIKFCNIFGCIGSHAAYH